MSDIFSGYRIFELYIIIFHLIKALANYWNFQRKPLRNLQQIILKYKFKYFAK